MAKKSFVISSIIVIISLVVLNGFIVNYLYGTDEYIRASDVNGSQYLEKRSVVRNSEKILSEYVQEDYGAAARKLTNEKNRLYDYRTALKYRDGDLSPLAIMYEEGMRGKPISEWTKEQLSAYDLSDEQAMTRIEQLDYCAERLNYAADYHSYIGYISDNTNSLIEMSLLDQNSYAAQNAAKTKRDFYGLENVKPTAESDLGVICMFSDHMTDLLAFACAIIIAVLFTQYRKKSTFSGNGGILGGCLTACIGAGLMYIVGGAVIDRSIGLGDLSRPVQSVRTFLTCSYVMSVGNLALLRLFFKLMLCAVVYYISVGIIMSPKRSTAVILTTLIAAAQIILYQTGDTLRAFSFVCALSSEEIFAVYRNIDLFGNAVSPQAIFLPVAAAAIVAAALFASKSSAAFGLAARENAERAYYDKISSTYDETRKIRHDIGNHLSALAVLLDNENVTEARRYLSEISTEMAAQRLPISSGRAVLDALLYSKATAAEKDGTTLKIEILTAIGEKYTDFDLCGIFGNILDNAIEGCNKTDGERFITLTVKSQMDMLCIFCENSCAPMKNADLSTDKPDKSAHGFGLKRIRQLAEKYGGGMEVSTGDGTFSISVII